MRGATGRVAKSGLHTLLPRTKVNSFLLGAISGVVLLMLLVITVNTLVLWGPVAFILNALLIAVLLEWVAKSA